MKVAARSNRNPERLKQAVAADSLLQFLRERIKQGGTPLRGYAEVCKALGYKNSAGMYAGQVCSRLDLACYHAGLPMVTLHWVRKPDGSINSNGLRGWEHYQDELRAAAEGHAWTPADLDLVQAELDKLPNRGAKPLWKGIEDQDVETWGRQLHARVPRWTALRRNR